jgi:hypothetical protein
MAVEVTVEVVIDDGPHAGPGRRTVLQLCWRMAHPLALELNLTALPEHPALARGRWVVARDSLHAALSEPTGDGVVKLRPDELRDRVWFELDRPGMPACVSVGRTTVAGFLAQTERYVPYGAEASGPAVDALLDEVLDYP